jgi:hypothetical protein
MITTAITVKVEPVGPFAEPRTAASLIMSTRLFLRGCRFAAKNSKNSKKVQTVHRFDDNLQPLPSPGSVSV